MGIELPAELADVAARAGVRWPQADEEAMRSTAQAWRQAGAQLTSLTKDADGSAGQALSAVSGSTGTAAHQHWQTFVAPDTGHLTSTASGCTEAADRLDHAADEVGAAKVRIVSHLVDLAKNTDAANQAAAAGHPTALAGLRTAVRGTASSVAQVNHSLTNSIRLDNAQSQPAATGHNGALGQHSALVHAGVTGQHGLLGSQGPLAQVGVSGDDGSLGQQGPLAQVGVGGHAGLLGQQGLLAQTGVTGRGGLPGSQGPLGQNGVVGSAGPPAPAGLTGQNGLLGQQGPLAQVGVGGHAGLLGSQGPLAQVGVSGHDGSLGQQGPLAQVGVGGHAGLLGSQGPLAQVGVSGHDGSLGQDGSIAPVGGHDGLLGSQGPSGHDGPAAATGPLLAQPGHGGPGPGGLLGSQAGSGGGPGPGIDGGRTGPIPISTPGGPAQPIGPVLGGHDPGHVPTPPMGLTVAQSAAPTVAPPPAAFAGPAGAPIAAVPMQHAAPISAAPTPSFGTPAPNFAAAPPPVAAAPPIASTPPPAATAGSTPAPAGRAAAQAQGVVGVVDGPRSAAEQPGRRTVAALPGVSAGPGRPSPRRDEVALFLVYLFPIGQLPKASARPARQLPPPAEETDFAAGLRFEPHDHPESHLVDTGTAATAPPAHHGFAPADPEVAELAEGHDPLGGQHERDWDHRFLVRPADGEQQAEYAWPPGELFPEGGCDTGEPIVLTPGTVLDRFGTPEGRVFGEDGTPFARRSLPPDHLAAGYHRYRVTRDLPVWRTLAAAWFGQPGGGERYRAVYPAADLIALGYLIEITGTDDDGH